MVPRVPSQNGLFFDAPHLHNDTPRIVESGGMAETYNKDEIKKRAGETAGHIYWLHHNHRCLIR
jgi:hypothetical protein